MITMSYLAFAVYLSIAVAMGGALAWKIAMLRCGPNSFADGHAQGYAQGIAHERAASRRRQTELERVFSERAAE